MDPYEQWLRQLPVVLSEAEVRAVRRELKGDPALVVGLLYGRELTVRNGKGGKDRRLHQQDLAAGWGAVMLPHALARKYCNAERQWCWQGCFPNETAGRTPLPR